MKLRKYAAQSIIVDVGRTSSTDFSVEETSQAELIQNGYHAAMSYLMTRYAKKEGSPYQNQEIMHTVFSSLEELLAYCCYRGNKFWFDRTCELIKKSSLFDKKALITHSRRLKSIYFNSIDQEKNETATNSYTFFGNELTHQFFPENTTTRHEILLALYPIFLKISPFFLKNAKEYSILERSRHSFTAQTPFSCLKFFSLIKDEIHIIFYFFRTLVEELQRVYQADFLDIDQVKYVFFGLELVQKTLHQHKGLCKPEYYRKWDFSLTEGFFVLETLERGGALTTELAESLHKRSKPLQKLNETVYECEDEKTQYQVCTTL
jgi:NTE family protein